MRWLWRNIRKLRYLYQIRILGLAANTRFGVLALGVSVSFWFVAPFLILGKLGQYDYNHWGLVQRAQETTFGFASILCLGLAFFVYQISAFYPWECILLRFEPEGRCFAKKRLKMFEEKLEALERARHPNL